MADETCGNQIVEESEDCDTFAPEGLTCERPGRLGACRLVCDPTLDAGCPKGWHCGLDGICRVTGQKFEPTRRVPHEIPPDPLSPFIGSEIALVDLDQDARADLLRLSRHQISVRFGAGDGVFEDPLSVPIQSTVGGQIWADVDADGAPEVLFTQPLGLSVARVTSGREIVFETYRSGTIDLRDVFFTLRSNDAGDDLLAVSVGEATIDLVDPTEDRRLIQRLVQRRDPVGGDDLNVFVTVANLDSMSSSEIVISSPDSGDLLLFRVCAPREICPIGSVSLPFQLGAPVLVADVDGDGLQDLIARSLFDPSTIAVAYRDSEGRFCGERASGRCDGERSMAAIEDRYRTSTSSCASGAEPLLVVVDLDRDGRTDYVTGAGIYFTQPDRSIALATCFAFRPAAEVVVGDFTSDGALDIVAAGAGDPGLLLLLGDGKRGFRRVFQPRDGRPRLLTPGDFDGDSVLDLAFAEGDAVLVSFGRVMAELSEAVVLARAPADVLSLLGGRLLGAQPARSDLGADLVDDLAVISGAPEPSITLLAGTSQRRLISPSAIDLSRRETSLFPSALLAGSFGTKEDLFTDLLVVGTETFVTPERPRNVSPSLWLVEGGPNARFDPGVEAPCEPCVRFVFSCGESVRAADLDGDRRDELVGVISPLCGRDQAGVFVAKIGARGVDLAIWPRSEALGAALDVVVATLSAQGAPTIAVLHERGLSFHESANPIGIERFVLEPLRAVVAIDLDGTEDRELAVLAESKVLAFDFEGGEITQLPDIARFEPGREAAGTSQFRAIDLDGDRIEDLLIADGRELIILKQRPRHR
jgi:hypothetical protein